MSKKNIVTAMVAVAAVMLVIVALLKTNASRRNDGTLTSVTTSASELETTMVLMSEVDEDGNIDYYTVTSYVKPGVSSNFRYPTTVPRSTKPGETTLPFIEVSYTRYVFDEQGNNVLDENGNPVIEVVIETQIVTEPPTTTAYVPVTGTVNVTDAAGVPLTNADGTPVTSVVVLNPTTKATTEAQVSTTEKRTLLPEITFSSSRMDDIEDSIVSSVNSARSDAGLKELKVATSLKGAAYVRSMQKAYPDFQGSGGSSGDAYNLLNIEGTDVAAAVMNGSIGKNAAMNADYTKIGVAVVKIDGKYYTTIIFN